MTEDRIEQVIELTRLATESALSEHILAKEGERPRVIVRHYPARWRVDEEGEPVREEECISVAIYFLDWLAWPQPCVVSEWRDTPRVTRGGDERTITLSRDRASTQRMSEPQSSRQ